MKITIITPDFSSNCLGRSYLLAQLLKKHHTVKIIGPMSRKNIWYPLADAYDIPFIPIRFSNGISQFLLKITKIIKEIKGDIVYVCKPLITSYGPGLIAKRKFNMPLILDIDDWEMAPFMAKGIFHKYIQAIYYINKPFSFFPCALLDKYTSKANLITVSTNELKKMYGGFVVPHVRKIVTAKKRVVKNKKIVLFLGTPRPHKGLSDLIEAFRLIPNHNVILQIIGIDESDVIQQSLASLIKKDNRIRLHGQIRFNEISAYMAQADIVVIPQRDSPCGKTQLPAKLFDAMALGRAIISTRLSDIPEILGDAGIIVEPNNIISLRNAIISLLNNPRKISQLGKKAQARCRKSYNFDLTSESLHTYIISNLHV